MYHVNDLEIKINKWATAILALSAMRMHVISKKDSFRHSVA